MIKDIKKKHEENLKRKNGVIGVGVGKKESGGIVTDEDAVMVLVRRKKSEKALLKSDLVPKEVDGVKTDVIEVGDIKALSDPKLKYRPALGGVSLGHYAITTGTFGVLVTGEDGKKYILSNNHVLANENNARIGDPIFQPGPYDSGTDNDAIATLARFIPLDFGGVEPPPPPPDEDDDESSCPIANLFKRILNFGARKVGSSYRLEVTKRSGKNYVDCALALPISPSNVIDGVLDIGNVMGYDTNYTLHKPIKKMGRTTGYTEGQIMTTDLSVDVTYSKGKIATFYDQILAGPMSAGGDSGSIILTNDNRAIGLLFAGSEYTTIINPIDEVMSALKIAF